MKSFRLPSWRRSAAALAGVAASVTSVGTARADVVTEWNTRAVEFVVAAGLPNQPAHRVLAITHTAAFEAIRSAAQQPVSERASFPAALTAAHCTVLMSLLPTQQGAIDGACRAALAAIAPGSDKEAGIALGERTARETVAGRADDGAAVPETYRPFSASGRYVPTMIPASPQWVQRRPWLMRSPSQFRPPVPPALDSERWSRDYNEVKMLGGARSATRSPEQTEIARFWETSHPSIYHEVLRGVADQPGRDLLRNARLFAMYTQAIDDGMIAVWDAKYHYAFWRPITAIRNGDIDGHDGTERDASWTPLVPTPMHPEYPCAHCMQAGVMGAVLTAEANAGKLPELTTHSPSAKNARRRWTDVDQFVQEVGNARIWDGVHYRFSVEAGTEIGRRIGASAVQRFSGE